MVDKTRAVPKGIIKDIPINTCKFIIPTDFVIRDYEANDKAPIIFRHPYFATSRA